MALPRSVRHRAYLDACVSVFVFSFLFRPGPNYVSKMVPQILKNASQMGPKAPNFGPKSVKMDQKWVQNGQDGSQNDHCGAKIANSGLEHDFLGAGIQKKSPKWRPKWSKNRSKNHSKKRLCLEAGSDAIFACVLPISTPKWCQNGARWVPKSTQKPLPVEKAGFRSDTAKQRV